MQELARRQEAPGLTGGEGTPGKIFKGPVNCQKGFITKLLFFHGL